MKKCNTQGSINSIETFGLVDGPGIRTVFFLNGCNLRCKFCHNPETWNLQQYNYTPEELVNKAIRNKPYFKNGGGVTFSGGDPLLQYDFLVETCKLLKENDIHVAIDTAGIGLGNYKELLDTIDLVLLDIKAINEISYKDITQTNRYNEFLEFVKQLNESNVEVWIRQVIVPDVNDNERYVIDLAHYIKQNIKNVTKIEFLPFHTLGNEKYKSLKIKNQYENKEEMNKNKCNDLYKIFKDEYEKSIQ